MVEATGNRELEKQYRQRFLAMDSTRKKKTSSPKVELTTEELALIHNSAEELGQKTIKVLQESQDIFKEPSRNNALAVVQHAIVLLFTFGTSKDWSNQRRCCLSYAFKDNETPRCRHCLITFDAKSAPRAMH
jgi:hypothetical protein